MANHTHVCAVPYDATAVNILFHGLIITPLSILSRDDTWMATVVTTGCGLSIAGDRTTFQWSLGETGGGVGHLSAALAKAWRVRVGQA